jgi:hypothetical protein
MAINSARSERIYLPLNEKRRNMLFVSRGLSVRGGNCLEKDREREREREREKAGEEIEF